MWDQTPIDLFFAYDPFHDAAGAARRTVPFADSSIPILSPEHLIVCKVVFDRPKDWVDIDAMLDAGVALDVAEILRWVGRIAGDDDPRYERIAAVLDPPLTATATPSHGTAGSRCGVSSEGRRTRARCRRGRGS